MAMAGCLLGWVACASDPISSVAQIYGYASADGADLPPIVVTSGFLGSVLEDRDTGHVVWGRFLAGEQRIFNPEIQRRLALPMIGGDSLSTLRDNVVAVRIMDNARVKVGPIDVTANAYPGLKKYDHLVGNYGGAWQDQRKEFPEFPGAILMTTNCIQRPQASYQDRIFTSGLVAWPGVTHVEDRDFTPLIETALTADGFAEDAPEKTITIGFGHAAVLSVADSVVGAVKSGALRHFFFIGGCDGAKPGRNYYTEFAQAVPDDCVILTLACGKYRFNKLEFGDIGGIPRLLDMGQCNDAYSAIQVAVALAGAFECGVNDLPLSMIISWYEQKAVTILLTLLHLGIKDIRLGPSLPAFLTPAALDVLVEKFAIKPTTTAEEDLKAILG